jgi:plasmid stabilization system protein ParE
MKRWKVIVERPAQQDIAEAYLWLTERAPEAADRWFNSIYDTMASLEFFPERCPLAPEGRFLNAQIREIFHGRRHCKYRILFTVRKDDVHVLHVRHGARLALGECAPSGE